MLLPIQTVQKERFIIRVIRGPQVYPDPILPFLNKVSTPPPLES